MITLIYLIIIIIILVRASIVVSIPACHAGDRSSILRLGASLFNNKQMLCKLVIFYYTISIKEKTKFSIN